MPQNETQSLNSVNNAVVTLAQPLPTLVSSLDFGELSLFPESHPAVPAHVLWSTTKKQC